MSLHVLLSICLFGIMNTMAQMWNYTTVCPACNDIIVACQNDNYCNYLGEITLTNLGEGLSKLSYISTYEDTCNYWISANHTTACTTSATNGVDFLECITNNDCFQTAMLEDLYTCPECINATNPTMNTCNDDMYCNYLAEQTFTYIGEGEARYSYISFYEDTCDYWITQGKTACTSSATNGVDFLDCVTDNDCFQDIRLEDSYNCPACITETEACDNSQWCFLFANYTIEEIGLNKNVTQADYQMIVNKHWCANVNWTDCSANGFNDWYTCAENNNCMEFTCDAEYQTCDADIDCKALMTEWVTNRDSYRSMTHFAQENCLAWNGFQNVYTGDKDCSLFAAYQLCAAQQKPCEPPSEPGCNHCDVMDELSICLFDPQCSIPWAYLTDDNDLISPTIEYYCDQVIGSLCTPDDMMNASITFCNGVNGPCNTDYDTIFNWLYNCQMDNCVFRNCSGYIDTCNADVTCKSQLNYIDDISDLYGPQGEFFSELMRDYWCKQQTGGDCVAGLRNLETCFETKCFERNVSKSEFCYESGCYDEMGNCLNDDSCAVPVLDLLQTEQSCKVAINNMNDPNAPCNCAKDDDNPDTFYYQYVDGCRAMCDACGDSFIDLSIEKCSDGSCGINNEINSLYSCIWSNCETDCFLGNCANQFGNCLYGNSGDGMCSDTYQLFRKYTKDSMTNIPVDQTVWDQFKNDDLCTPNAGIGAGVGYGGDCANNGFNDLYNCLDTNCGFNYGIANLCQNDKCMYETMDCEANPTCLSLAQHIIGFGTWHIALFQIEQIIDLYFCGSDGINCDTNGFNNWFGCVSADSDCTNYVCPSEWDACAADAGCPELIEQIFSEDSDMGELIRQSCSSWNVAPYNQAPFSYAGTTDCSTAQAFSQCFVTELYFSKCEPDSDTCNFCEIIDSYFSCPWDPDCLVPLAYFQDNGYGFATDDDNPDDDGMDSLFPVDKLVDPSYQDTCTQNQRFCTPADTMTEKGTFCTSNSYGVSCNTDFDAIYDMMFVACGADDCVWNKCGAVINDCNTNDTCAQQLFHVASVKGIYGIGSQLIQQDIRAYYCRNQAGGKCHPTLETAIGCYETRCANFTALRCYEKQCETPIAACIESDACAGPLLDIFYNQTACRREINEMYGLLNPPNQCRCPDSDGNTNFDYETYWNATGYSADCRDMCERCDDSFLPLALEKCGDQMSCGDEFNAIFRCTLEHCPSKADQEDCVSNNCPIQLVDCILEDNCYNSVIVNELRWVQVLNNSNVFFDNELFSPPISYVKSVLTKEYCSDDDITCGNNFFNLWECLVGECLYNVCPYQNCKTKLETCYGNEDCRSNMEWFRQQLDSSCAADQMLKQCRYDEVIERCRALNCGTLFYDAFDCLFEQCYEADILEPKPTPDTPCAVIEAGLAIGVDFPNVTMCGFPYWEMTRCFGGRQTSKDVDKLERKFGTHRPKCTSSDSVDFDLGAQIEVTVCYDCVNYKNDNFQDYIKLGFQFRIFNTNAYKFLYYVVDETKITDYFQNYLLGSGDTGYGKCIWQKDQCTALNGECSNIECGIDVKAQLDGECQSFVDNVDQITTDWAASVYRINFTAIIMIALVYLSIN